MKLSWPAYAALGVGGLVAAYLLGWFDGAPPDPGDDTDMQTDDSWKSLALPNNGVVAHRERAAGVDPRLDAFLDAWEQSGPFRIVVCPDGGLRTDSALQASLAALGNSKASDLSQTPHGRGGAVDVAPYWRDATGLLAPQYGFKGPFSIIGTFAKARGLTWGGDFGSLYDGPHVEVPDWRSLPFPPSDFGGVA